MTEMTEKESQSAKIRKGLSARRDPTCYQVVQDIVIPAGTILRDFGAGGKDFSVFSAMIGLYAEITIKICPGEDVISDKFKRVVAS